MYRVVTVLVLLLAAAACDTTEQAAPSPTPAATATATPEGEVLAQSCTAEDAGFRVGYPDGWFTNEQGEPCRWFHPARFDLPQPEATGIAVHIDLVAADFAQLSGDLASGPDVAELRSREETTVAGREAVRVQYVSSGAALLPEGTLVTTYAVRWEEQTLVATTTSVATAGTYEQNVDVLALMMDSLVDLAEMES